MITFVKAYKTSDGTAFEKIEEAQKHELQSLISHSQSMKAVGVSAIEISDMIIAERDKIIDILTMTPKSKPRARAVNGGTKVRKLKPSSPPNV